MSIEELEAAALKLEPKARARLAERLLDSLENLSPEENARIWAEEAQRRVEALESGSLSSRSADEVFREARARKLTRPASRYSADESRRIRTSSAAS